MTMRTTYSTNCEYTREDGTRGSAGGGAGTLREAIERATADALYYASLGYTHLFCTVTPLCAECHGSGRVDTGRHRTKRCGECRGKSAGERTDWTLHAPQSVTFGRLHACTDELVEV